MGVRTGRPLLGNQGGKRMSGPFVNTNRYWQLFDSLLNQIVLAIVCERALVKKVCGRRRDEWK